MFEILGRKQELKELNQVLDSQKPAFLAIYGRRRIGKTYLIENFFRTKGIFFHLTGIQDATLDVQLANFAVEFSDRFRRGEPIETPKDWFSAFQILRKEIEQLPRDAKIILFFDELPWLATPRSKLLQALDHFWNRYISSTPNVILIVCGSAASWMLENIISQKGGLHGRITKEMRLLPFSLTETEQFLSASGVHLDRKQLIELYMCLGGVAKYLTYVESGKSAAQIIGELCFSLNGPLVAEFYKLYRSLFHNYEEHIHIVKALGNHRSGLSYQELALQCKILTGGTLTKRLEELKQSGFISESFQFDKGEKNKLYLLADEYSLFYLRWISQAPMIDLQNRNSDFWLMQRNTQSWRTWTGHAFENVCFKHIARIKNSLGISAVHTQSSRWRYIPTKGSEENGAEIDLLIDRADQCINLCEIKFYNDLMTFTQKDADDLRSKRACFERVTGTKKSVLTTLITPYGIKPSIHLAGVVDIQMTADELFA